MVKNSIKKIVAILAILSLMLFAGCSGTDETVQQEEGMQVETDEANGETQEEFEEISDEFIEENDIELGDLI